MQRTPHHIDYDILVNLYVWGYPTVLMYKAMDRHFFGGAFRKESRRFNEFHTAAGLSTNSTDWVTAPNCDTCYCNAWLSIAESVVEIKIPPMGERFYILHAVNFFNDTVFKIGSRELGASGGTFQVAGPRAQCSMPDSLHTIHLNDSHVWIFGRVQVHPSEEPGDVENLCDTIRIINSPLIEYDWPRFLPKEEAYFENLSSAYQRLYTSGVYNSIKERVKLHSTKSLVSGSISDEAARVSSAAQEGRRLISVQETKFEEMCAGWVWEGNAAGKPYRSALEKAASASAGLGILEAEDAVYPYCYWDSSGETLIGSNDYSITFRESQIPDVYHFWSLTVYALPHYTLVSDKIEENTINDRSALVPNPEAGFTIFLSRHVPDDAGRNALRLPAGRFVLAMRIFGPSERIRTRTLTLPRPEKRPQAGF